MKSKKKRKVNPWSPSAPYAQIEEKLVRSKGFRDLRAHTKWLFVEFRLRYKGNNPREIILTLSDGMKIMNERTFRADVRILLERGFIDLIKRGGFYKQPNIYGLSNRWKKYENKDFIEFDLNKTLPGILKKV